jgi:hypothetical protein
MPKDSYICEVCHEFVMNGSAEHKCSGKAIPSMRNMWGLPYVAEHELNSYTFPDLSAIVDQIDVYIKSLQGKGAWPTLSKTLKLGKEVTAPGMVLILGNPQKAKNTANIVCTIMNDKLPGVSYKTVHSNYGGPSSFTFSKDTEANEFFLKTGAINIMPSDANWAGDPPATQLTDGGILVNAHSKCATGLMVHEIFHAYGGPAGFLGEGLTDWFAIDFMRNWGKEYAGNPAYAYNVNVVDRLISLAGKERTARMVFCSENAWASAKGSMEKALSSGKTTKITVTYRTVLQEQGNVTNFALNAQLGTMQALGLGDKIATMVPKPASAEEEAKAGLPGALATLSKVLTTLMPG